VLFAVAAFWFSCIAHFAVLAFFLTNVEARNLDLFAPR
jgi:hypothetical protein